MNKLNTEDMIELNNRISEAVIMIDSGKQFTAFMHTNSKLISVYIRGAEDGSEYTFSENFHDCSPKSHEQKLKEVEWHLVGEEEDQ
jgi:hypothetical protein